MLENIREGSQGWIAKSILGLVILTFALAGIGTYTNSVDTSVADVNGEKISQDAFNKAYQAQRNRMAQQFGDMFETLSADENYMANFRNGILDNLINEKLIDQSTVDMSIRASDERIKQTIRTMTEFQVDGVFDNNRYLAMINQAGFYQSSDFRDYLRVQMTRRQLTQALVASEFNLPYQEKRVSALQNQKRNVRYATINAEQFKAGIELTDDEINQYYLANQGRFENEEKVKLNYIALDVNDIAKTIEVSDADVKAYYQENIASYRQDEQRRVAHILIEFGDDEVVAKVTAEALLARVNAGEDFATLAKESSDDTFSGENGGDLEWIERGAMGDAFDEGAFALTEINSVSDVVESDFGFHIIKLTDLKAEQVQAFADVEVELQAKVSQSKAQDKFFDLQQEMARLSFEAPDSLDEAAEAVNSKIMTTDWLSKFGNVAPFDSPKAIEAAFSDLVLQENLNSDIIEVSDTLAIVIRLEEYQPAEVKPLTEVTVQIRDTLISEKATELAQTTADSLLVSFKAGNDISEQLTAINAVFIEKADVTRSGSDIAPSLSREAFKLPHPSEGQISATTVTLNNGDLALLEVQAVIASNVEKALDPRMAQQQTQQLAQSAYQSFVEALKVNAEITRKAIAAPVSQF
ncbi:MULTISPECIES: SurA N-terminal domain-containing protein [unclassified Colwellia]|jgi:peptidyl-prolyl cis-trans isomerase D|uniref:SurA N-terminal domain-containing protein n=1 Tax=unclassified Colwellia TaxID=196834 RepID=UPI0015F4629E|nr:MULTISPECIES: SurA N-terminal domain-containing protein [unclassified Colwellia]MBA6364861.1 SurA N-terminal domain-containing protein [Colwellia sp. BRX8-8]MBA6338088.1 SurA N-terminal domain-containing protein [Colwellia sp. BRX8-7]MBA6347275.1 SurA N-terminal domain-containing protein [Colwellia sp. BRX8-9]MBA6351171.1 SurA N-terminal domain-containing protein [Colwellia sp. BRX9-1]MBA6370561.1 SurA N-terminal domain-containing protein [Colwellia sp. BRX8-4]